MKNLVVISDLHCGSIYGLTPPDWQSENSPHHYKLQRESWNAYKRLVYRWQSPDVLLVNGDCIEGRQDRQGGAELLTNDRNIQSDMAIKSIKEWNAKKIIMTYGTSYHTGSQAEDFEYNIANTLNATIEGRIFFELEGVTFDARHKVCSSSTSHTRATSLLKEIGWDLMREGEGEWPKVDIVIRSHTHYHLWVESQSKVAFTTPALQLSRGRYGSRELSGTTHWGAVQLTVSHGKIVKREVELCSLRANKPKLIKIE